MKLIVAIMCLSVLAIPAFAEGKKLDHSQKKNTVTKKLRKPGSAELTEEEKRLAEAGEKQHQEMNKNKGEPMPDSLKDKMAWPEDAGKK